MTSHVQTGRDAPWKRRFRAPAIAYSAIARDAPARGIAALNQEGPYQIYAWDVPTGQLERRTDRPEGLVGALLSPDGRHIYYLDDQRGNEIGHFVRIPYEGGAPEDVTPGLPPYSPGFAFMSPIGLAISRSGNRLALTAGTEDGFRVYAIDVDASGALGEPREIYHCEPLITAPLLSSGGELLVIGSTERYKRPQYSLLAFDAASGERLGELWEGDAFSVTPLFTSPRPGDLRVAALTNQTGFERLVLWNPQTGERTDPALSEIEGAVNAFDWSPDGRYILFRTFNQAVQQMYLYDVGQASAYRLNHPPGTNFSPYFGPEGDVYSHLATAIAPPRLVSLDLHSGAVKAVLIEAGDAPPGRPWRSITFPTSGGQAIQGWLAVPEGDGPFPLILDTHGGPQAVQAVNFRPDAQAWVDHGFAWASINYRGSTTFGKAFEEQIWGNPGQLEVEDMVAACEYLVGEGVAAPDRVFLSGYSYGGYLTLQALGLRPDLWAGGLAGIAIADWALTYEDSAEALKQYCVAFFGGTPDEKPEQYTRSSPITYAERVRAPVLIVQGRNDTRTPARPIEVYEQKMKALGKQIQVHWFDAGHAGPFAQVEQAIEHLETMLRFAFGVLREPGG
jgi:dipeptidyl aminopeptidase/acylaminoacyl peptidase